MPELPSGRMKQQKRSLLKIKEICINYSTYITAKPTKNQVLNYHDIVTALERLFSSQGRYYIIKCYSFAYTLPNTQSGGSLWKT